jgi:DNA-binding NarL/FixJ family response regulator
MSDRIGVSVVASDPVSQAGVAAELRGRPEIRIVENGQSGEASVAVVVVDTVTEDAIRTAKGVARNGAPSLILVATDLDDSGLVAAVEAGANGLLRRADATPEALVSAIQAASAGDGTVPPDLLGRLLRQVGRLQRHVLAPRGLTFSGLSERELDVLRLVADGMSTSEIAKRLSYSERTIKNVIHDITARLQLRNRSQAVAYAMREGLL